MSFAVYVTSTPSGVDIVILQQSGNIGLASLTTDSPKDHGWILDSEAIDHMTFDASLLHYHRSHTCSTVANANGVSSLVTSAGSVDLTSSLTLEHILLLHSFSNNLLFIL